MENENKSPLAEKKKENNGEFLVRVLKPFGCFLVLLIFVLYLIFCFTYKHDPAADASPAPTAQAAETAEPAAEQS